MLNDLKKTPLVEQHMEMGAKMVDFGGWYMPLQYTGLVDEHLATRTRATLFDVSHMGEIRVEGPEAEQFVDVLTTNSVTRLIDGQIHYTVMLYENGTVVDDLLVYKVSTKNYLLVVNASNLEKDFEWIQRHSKPFAVQVTDESYETAQIAIQGPCSESILQKLTTIPLDQIKYYHFVYGEVASVPCLVSRTGYTGEDGFELYFSRLEAPAMWGELLKAGKNEGIQPAGLGARDTLRLEARMALYGHEIDDTISPLEAGLKWVVKLTKKAEFIGKKALEAMSAAGIKRTLVGFEIPGKGIPRQGYPVMYRDTQIGEVASGTFSPTLQKGIGTALVTWGEHEPGEHFQIQVRNKLIEARTVKGAFYQRPK